LDIVNYLNEVGEIRKIPPLNAAVVLHRYSTLLGEDREKVVGSTHGTPPGNS
jgi:hypothetical protein